MRQFILNKDHDLGNNRRLIRRVWKVEKSYYYPKGLEFTSQYLYKKEDIWIQIVRIDNQLHSGKPGVHIHVYGKEGVKWEEMTFEETYAKILDLGDKIIQEMV